MKLPLGKKRLNNVCRNETIFNPQRASQLYWNGKENKYKCIIVYAKN